MDRRVIVQWTTTAKKHLATLPPKVRRGLLDKVNILRNSGDPTKGQKTLTGRLQGYYRVTYGRYRLVYSVEEETLANGDKLIHVRVVVVAVGLRKALDRGDIYNVAMKLIELGLIDGDVNEDEIQEPPSEAGPD